MQQQKTTKTKKQGFSTYIRRRSYEYRGRECPSYREMTHQDLDARTLASDPGFGADKLRRLEQRRVSLIGSMAQHLASNVTQQGHVERDARGGEGLA